MAVDEVTGEVMVSWMEELEGEGRLLFSSSGDGGGTWSLPVEVARGPEIKGHGEASPLLLVREGGVRALIWTTSVRFEGREWPAADVVFARSGDGGIHWSSGVVLNDDTLGVPLEHSFHSAAWLGGDTLLVTWLDERTFDEDRWGRPIEAEPGSFTIVAAQSSDAGLSWAPRNEVLWGSTCPCCRMGLVGVEGRGIAVWRHHFPGSIRDIAAAEVLAQPPAPPSPVHEDGWEYPGCPHTGPAVATRDGVLHTAWFTGALGGAGIRYARGKAGGEHGLEFDPAIFLLGGEAVPRTQVGIAALEDGGALVAFALDPDSGEPRLRIVRIGADGEVESAVSGPAAPASYPRLVTGVNDAWVVWTEPGADRSRVQLARLTGSE